MRMLEQDMENMMDDFLYDRSFYRFNREIDDLIRDFHEDFYLYERPQKQIKSEKDAQTTQQKASPQGNKQQQ